MSDAVTAARIAILANYFFDNTKPVWIPVDEEEKARRTSKVSASTRKEEWYKQYVANAKVFLDSGKRLWDIQDHVIPRKVVKRYMIDGILPELDYLEYVTTRMLLCMRPSSRVDSNGSACHGFFRCGLDICDYCCKSRAHVTANKIKDALEGKRANFIIFESKEKFDYVIGPLPKSLYYSMPFGTDSYMVIVDAQDDRTKNIGTQFRPRLLTKEEWLTFTHTTPGKRTSGNLCEQQSQPKQKEKTVSLVLHEIASDVNMEDQALARKSVNAGTSHIVPGYMDDDGVQHGLTWQQALDMKANALENALRKLGAQIIIRERRRVNVPLSRIQEWAGIQDNSTVEAVRKEYSDRLRQIWGQKQALNPK